MILKDTSEESGLIAAVMILFQMMTPWYLMLFKEEFRILLAGVNDEKFLCHDNESYCYTNIPHAHVDFDAFLNTWKGLHILQYAMPLFEDLQCCDKFCVIHVH